MTDGTKCSVCGEIITEQQTIDALGHKAETIKGKSPTCTESGLTDGTKCSVCGEILTEQKTIDALGHKAVIIPGKEATATESGLTEGSRCSVCNKVLIEQQIIEPLGETMHTAELHPFASGFITKPVNYYTAYYDVDFHIEKMYAEFNDDGNRIELLASNDSSFTDNACMIEIPYNLEGTSPTVRIYAEYSEKVTKLAGTPVFQLDGYQIKATLNGYTEYFTPSATPPSALVSAGQIVPLKDYLKFERTTSAGIKEEFYLALRPTSTSRFSINGLSPTNFEKVFMVSQDLNKYYYSRINSCYAKYEGMSDITFIDGTDPSLQNYDEWRAVLKDSVDTFNSCLKAAGIDAHIREVSAGESENYICYGEVPDDYAGLCQYYSSQHRFIININNNPYMIKNNASLKTVIIHEMGHLLGFNDSAYALDDSLYSYSKDYEKVTYFQPNDIATLKYWLNR